MEFPETTSFQAWVKDNRCWLHQTLLDGTYTCPCCGGDMDVDDGDVECAINHIVEPDPSLIRGDKTEILIREMLLHFREQIEEDRKKFAEWMGVAS